MVVMTRPGGENKFLRKGYGILTSPKSTSFLHLCRCSTIRILGARRCRICHYPNTKLAYSNCEYIFVMKATLTYIPVHMKRSVSIITVYQKR